MIIRNIVSYLFLGRTASHAGAIVLEQMFGAVLDAGRSIRVLAQGIGLPAVRDGVVALHRRTLLRTHPVVIEITAGLKTNTQIITFICFVEYVTAQQTVSDNTDSFFNKYTRPL